MSSVREVPYRIEFYPGRFDHCISYAICAGVEYQWYHCEQEWLEIPTSSTYAEVA